MAYKRKYPRFPMSGLVVIKVPETDRQFSGMIETIARGGIGVYTREKIKEGDRVSLQIVSFTGSTTSDYSLTGIIRNTERQNEFGVLGIEFDGLINSKDHASLYEYLVNEEKKLNELSKKPG